jgi:hypothetical protein
METCLKQKKKFEIIYISESLGIFDFEDSL